MNTPELPPATPAEIAHVVDLCVQSWPAGPRGRILTATFTDSRLPFATLLGVYEHLRDNETKPPAPGRFLEIAAELTRPRRMIADVVPDYSNAVDPPWWNTDMTREQWLARAKRAPASHLSAVPDQLELDTTEATP